MVGTLVGSASAVDESELFEFELLESELLEPERTRTFFPETWLWSDAVTG